MTNSSESEKFAFESSRSLTEEQQQRIERNKQLALERRQAAKLLSNSQSLGNGKFYAGFYLLTLIYQGHVRTVYFCTIPPNKIILGIEKCDVDIKFVYIREGGREG